MKWIGLMLTHNPDTYSTTKCCLLLSFICIACAICNASSWPFITPYNTRKPQKVLALAFTLEVYDIKFVLTCRFYRRYVDVAGGIFWVTYSGVASFQRPISMQSLQMKIKPKFYGLIMDHKYTILH